MYFTDDGVGNFEKNRTRLIYKRNKKIYYFAREQYTNDDMKKIFDNSKIYCVPDIVLSLNNIESVTNAKRNGIICCLRNDKESAFCNEQREEIISRLQAVKDVEHIDTVCDYMITEQTREKELFNMWNRFASAELVVTDRLHGMIFALITNTPCIAFSNNNKKVLGVYKWIEDFDIVKFLENVTDLNEEMILCMIDTAKNIENHWNDFNEKYFCLKKVLQEAAYNGEN
jgi:pyruvyl transferase EpsI